MASLTENINKAIADFNGIKNAIEESGVSVADTDGTDTYSAKVKRVHDKGKADMLSEFWDAWQDYGNRTDYRYDFAYWRSETKPFLKPKYDIRPIDARYMFFQNKAITNLPEWCEECGITLDFGQCTNISYWLHGSAITHVGVIDSRSLTFQPSTFCFADNLVTVDKFLLKSDGSQSFGRDAFFAANLENITFEGVIGKDIWFHYCTKLITASLLSILTALSKNSALASGKTITLATAHKAKIETDTVCTAQLNAAIAAGWSVAYA